ncbi:MAG: AEC family transporter [Clostridiales bacterium]|nr:AEC family transporter [Clostridiales bacterium]
MEILLVLQKILSMFLIIFVGAFAYKIKWLPKESEKYLTTLMINIAAPCLVFYSMQAQDRTEVMAGKAIQSFVLMTAVLLACSVAAIFIVKLLKAPRNDRGIYRLMIVFTNCGFMGYPLAEAVFGDEGLFLAIIANMSFNIVIFSAGALLLIYDQDTTGTLKDTLKKILSIPLVSCTIGLFIFFLGIKFPPLLADTCELLGDMTAPLAMLLVGVQLCQSKVSNIIKNKRLLLITVIRLIGVPAVLFFALMWVPVDPLVFCVVVFAMSMPAAAYIAVLATRYESNKILAAEGIFLSTMFSLFTIPIIGMILNLYLMHI